jgi:hypothetical protein
MRFGDASLACVLVDEVDGVTDCLSGRISPSLPTLDRIAAALGAEVTVTFTDTELIGTSR